MADVRLLGDLIACFHGFDDVIEAILPYKPNLEIVNVYGGTPLSGSVYGSLHSWRKDGNYPRSVALLVEAGSKLRADLQGSSEVNDVLRRYGVG